MHGRDAESQRTFASAGAFMSWDLRVLGPIQSHPADSAVHGSFNLSVNRATRAAFDRPPRRPSWFDPEKRLSQGATIPPQGYVPRRALREEIFAFKKVIFCSTKGFLAETRAVRIRNAIQIRARNGGRRNKYVMPSAKQNEGRQRVLPALPRGCAGDSGIVRGCRSLSFSLRRNENPG